MRKGGRGGREGEVREGMRKGGRERVMYFTCLGTGRVESAN